MCGIVGFKGLEDASLLSRMKNLLRHRGPDQDGSFIDKDVCLGHQRLSILDLSEKGRQPMSNETGTVWVVFNGEIYNYRALRQELENIGHEFVSESDTEVLVHGFEAWGENLPLRLDGDFAFAIWDASRKRLFLARDPFGVNPLYYAYVDGVFFFSSEIKSLFEFEKMPRRLSRQAFSEYLTFRYPIGPHTLFENIHKVQPGQYLVVDKKISKKTYYDVQYRQAPWTENYAIFNVRKLFEESVQKRLQSDVPLGVYLSGGLDSSFVTAMASSRGPVHTFTVSFGTDDDDDYVQEIVSRFETKHMQLRVDSDRFDLLGKICWHLDEPPADIAALPTYLMAQATKKHATVVLTGDGGDEVFAGYSRYSTLLKLDRLKPVLAPFSFAAPLVFSSATISDRVKKAIASKNRWTLSQAYGATFDENDKSLWLTGPCEPVVPHPSFLAPEDFLNQMLSFDQKTLLPDDYLMKVNKMSLAHGVEARVPFLDKQLVSFCATLPVSLKANYHNTRILQRKAMKGLVPDRILSQRKRGFNVPTETWMGEGLKEVAAQLFETLANRGYFRKEKLASFASRFNHMGKGDSRIFWSLLGFEIWHQTFLDPDKPRLAKL